MGARARFLGLAAGCSLVASTFSVPSLPASAISTIVLGGTTVSALLVSGCSSAPRTTTAPEPRRLDPPGNLSSWDQLSWIERQIDSLPANADADRAALKVRAAELYVEVQRPDKAGVSAREAIFALGREQGSIASRAHAVLGAVSLIRGDAATARSEVDRAVSYAESDSDVTTAYGLKAIVAERGGNASEAAAARSRMRSSSDPRLRDLVDAIVAAAPAPRPAPVAVAPPTQASSGPKIITRAEWNPAPIGKNVDPMGPVSRITIHHEAAEYYGTTKAEGLKKMRDIQRFHQRDRGYADIGYHYIVDRVGNIFEGRPISLQGAHAGNINKKGQIPNAGNIGISLLGDYEKKQTPTAPQERALRELVSWLQGSYRIPQQNVFTHAEIRNMYDLGGTACPGCNLAPIVIDIRKHGPNSNRPAAAGLRR